MGVRDAKISLCASEVLGHQLLQELGFDVSVRFIGLFHGAERCPPVRIMQPCCAGVLRQDRQVFNWLRLWRGGKTFPPQFFYAIFYRLAFGPSYDQIVQ